MKTLAALLPESIAETLSAEQQQITIKRLSLDSRDILPDDCFFAYPGAEIDRRDFIHTVLEKGAAIVIAELADASPIDDVRVIYLPNVQYLMGQMAASFYDHPSRELKLFGVTGTNGKTSTVWLLTHALQALGEKAAGIGPLFGGELTTPDPITLQQQLRQFVETGMRYVCMEVSSHALQQYRVDAVHFDVVAFTNLTQDHLDYHRTMENYFAAKQRLFTLGANTAAIVNVGNTYGQRLAEQVNQSQQPLVTVKVEQVEPTLLGMKFVARIGDKSWRQTTQLTGSFNAENMSIVIAALRAWQFDDPAINAVLSSLSPVRGRLECRQVNGVTSVLDYAHTPDALENVLCTLRAMTAGELVCVFGCGGNRDRKKRAIMGNIAVKHADRVIITSDNPRNEEPMAIIHDVCAGIDSMRTVTIEVDRARAIALAYAQAKAGDCVLVAGKGHEDYQIIGTTKYAFDDRHYMRGFNEVK